MATETRIELPLVLVVDEDKIRASYDEYAADYDWYVANDPENGYDGPKDTFEESRAGLIEGWIAELVGYPVDGWGWRVEHFGPEADTDG